MHEDAARQGEDLKGSHVPCGVFIQDKVQMPESKYLNWYI